MLIVCPNCATSYDVDVASLRPNGRRVRCVRCHAIWQAVLSHADKLVAAADALGPVRRTVEAVAEVAMVRPQIPVSEQRFEVASDVDADGFGWPEADGFAGSSAGADEAALADFLAIESPPTAPEDLDAGRIADGIEAMATDAASAEFSPAETIAAEVPAEIEITPTHRASGRIKPGNRVWSLSWPQWGVLALVILDAIVVGWRADFVRLMPQTASFYAAIGLPVNLRGLAFSEVTTTTEQHEGVPILVVEGGIVNASRGLADMPHLRFAIRNAAHQEVYSWTAAPPRTKLAAGEAVSFHTRLASPPPDARDVLVRFLNRYDIMNGAR